MSVTFLDLSAMHGEIASELNAAWYNVALSAKFIGGELVERFEGEWAAYCGTRYCVGVSDGTAALTLAMAALGIGAGDEVIVPANTFIATAEAVVAVGARPVFVDVDPATLLLTTEQFEAACTLRTAAVIAVHLYGQTVDMDALTAVAAAKNIVVIEDAAQAHGAMWRGRRAGGLGRVGCFSFYPGKNLGAFGDAGAIVTNDFELAERARAIGNHGRSRSSPERHDFIGRNHRLDGLQAAILSVKLRRLDDWNRSRGILAEHYRTSLSSLPLEIVTIAADALSSHHLQVVRIANRNAVRRELAARGIDTGIHYAIPCHQQPAFAAFATPPLSVAESTACQLLSLPMWPHLGIPGVDIVVEALADALKAPGVSASWAA